MNHQEISFFYDRMETCLKKPLPGLSAQLDMAPIPRPGTVAFPEKEENSIPAGVLVLFFPKSDAVALALTQRSDKLPIHQAQISFPGGRQEANESLEKTALREAEEELGISTGGCRILGTLTPLYIPPTNFCIHPTVAGMILRPEFLPSEFEVSEVLEFPLTSLLDKSTVQRELWTIRGAPVDVPFFSFHGHKIWGATAMVLAELGRVVGDCLSERTIERIIFP